MRCPYCNKKVNDIPDHLGANEKCHKEHVDNLTRSLKYALIVQMNKSAGKPNDIIKYEGTEKLDES